MKYLLLGIQLLTIQFSFSQFTESQQQQIDSLSSIISNEESSAVSIIFSYNTLSDIMHVAYLDTVLYLGEKADSIANAELAKSELDEKTRKDLLEGKAAAQNSIGVFHFYNSNVSEALNYFEKSMHTREKIGDKAGLSESQNNLGFVYSNIGKTDVALDYYEKSLKLRQEIKDTNEIIVSLNNIGAIHYKSGDYVRATKNYEEAYSYSLKFDEVRSQAYILNNLANVYRLMGNGERAIELFRETAVIYRKVSDWKGLSSVLTNIGHNLLENGSLDSARSYFNESLKIATQENSLSNQGFIHANLSNVLYIEGNYKESLAEGKLSYEIFDELGDKKSITIAANDIARAYVKLGEIEDGLKYYHFAISKGKESHASESLTNTYRELSLLFINQKELDSARIYIEELMEIRNSELSSNFIVVSEREKELYFQTMEKDYMLYYLLTSSSKGEFDMGQVAYNNALRIKELSLKSTAALRNNILNSDNLELITLYNNWIKYKKAIAKYYAEGKETKNLEKETNRMEKELIAKSDVFKSFERAQSLTWQDVQEGLEKNEAAIEFVHYSIPTEEKNPITYYSALLLKKNESPKMIDLCTEAQLEEILGELQGNNIDFVTDIYGTLSNPDDSLYQLIWKPLEKSLKGITEIYLSPSGLFHKVSFSALSNKKGELLGNNYHLHTISSTGKILDKTESNPQSLTFGLFGGAKFNTEQSIKEIWTYLPGTLSEVDNIYAQLSINKEVKKFTGPAASESNFKQFAPSCNVLHIATHGYFYPDPALINLVLDEEAETENTGELEFRGGAYGYWSFVKNQNPLMRSGLALSGANDVWIKEKQASENDGVLTAQEVATLDLRNTELVVLSACETGLGDIKGSEGVYGLQRAFKMAGSRYVIMSLWQVPDKETAEFMTTFYNFYLESNDIPEAFRQTQLLQQKKYAPYYWAAFVLIE